MVGMFFSKGRLTILCIIVPCLCSIFQQTYSQNTFKGKVFDKVTNETIVGAKVSIPAFNIYTITDDSGRFIVAYPHSKSWILEISMLGYNTLFDTLNNSLSEKSYYLTPSVEDIDAVIVTAGRMYQSIKDAPVMTQVISREQLVKKGDLNLTSILGSEIAGLDIANFGYRPRISFQGLGAKYLLFLVDGERMAGEMEGDIDYYRLNLDNVDRIEIIRGPASLLYGSNAISGVVNIITRQPQSAFECGAMARYSKYNEISSSAYFGGRKNKFSSLTSLTANHTDGYDLTPEDPYSKNQEKYSNISVNQSFGYNFSSQLKCTLKANVYYNRIYDGIPDIKAVDHGYAGQSILSKLQYTSKDSTFNTFSFAMDRFVNYDILINLSNKHNKTASDAIYTFRDLIERNSKIGHWIGGVEWSYENLFSDKIVNQYANLHTIALFAQNNYKFNDKYSIVGGIRTVYLTSGKFSTVPNLCLVYSIPRFTFRATSGMGYRSPTLKEMYYSFDHMGMFYLYGNKNLKSENSYYLSLSGDYKINNLSIALNGYYNYLNNMISNALIGDRIFQYVNIDKARVAGIDWISKVHFLKSFNFSLNISCTDAKNLKSDSALYDIAPISATGSLSYSLSIHNKYFISIDLSDKYTGARTYDPVENLVYRDPAYHYWKIISSLRVRHFTLELGIDNLFNKVMPYSLGNISPGRRLFFVLGYQFAKY
jgi:outer membrane receptor for ferrienterochelin and colicins